VARRGHRYFFNMNFLTILETIAKVCGISTGDILSRSKKQPIATARQLSYWFARRGRTYEELATLFNRHYSNGIHAVKTINNRLDVGDYMTTNLIEKIERELAKT